MINCLLSALQKKGSTKCSGMACFNKGFVFSSRACICSSVSSCYAKKLDYFFPTLVIIWRKEWKCQIKKMEAFFVDRKIYRRRKTKSFYEASFLCTCGHFIGIAFCVIRLPLAVGTSIKNILSEARKRAF